MLLINKSLKISYTGDKSPVSIGRAPECDLQINFPTISKKHVVLVEDEAGWHVEDQGSANLTYINGEKVVGRAPLRAGDYLRLDVYTLLFFLKDPPQLPELVVEDPNSAIRQRLPMTHRTLRIGRNLVSNHLAIEDKHVSGQHLTLERQDRRWLATAAKAQSVVKINQVKIQEPTYVNPGDKIQIGKTTLEISAPILREWGAVSQSHTRLQELIRSVRVQARTLEDALHENYPAAKGDHHDWLKLVADVFAMVEERLRGLQQVADTVRSMIPSMETQESDNVILNQAIRDSRRSTNLANYLDLVLRNHQLVRIQNADFAEQRKLIGQLFQDVQGCIQQDNPTLLLK